MSNSRTRPALVGACLLAWGSTPSVAYHSWKHVRLAWSGAEERTTRSALLTQAMAAGSSCSVRKLSCAAVRLSIAVTVWLIRSGSQSADAFQPPAL